MKKQISLTNNQLKIIALILMTVDHIGSGLFPKYRFLRIIGRLAYPIFAYMIAEGCRYTKNKKKYFFTMASLAAVCSVVYFIAMRSLYQCILVTFSLSILMIFAFDAAQKERSVKSIGLAFSALGLAACICIVIPIFIPRFSVDYGFCGAILPLLIYFGRNKWERLGLSAIGLVLIALDYPGNQWFSLLALPLLALYNGKRGKLRLKYLFYIYYPLHLVIIYLISKII